MQRPRESDFRQFGEFAPVTPFSAISAAKRADNHRRGEFGRKLRKAERIRHSYHGAKVGFCGCSFVCRFSRRAAESGSGAMSVRRVPHAHARYGFTKSMFAGVCGNFIGIFFPDLQFIGIFFPDFGIFFPDSYFADRRRACAMSEVQAICHSAPVLLQAVLSKPQSRSLSAMRSAFARAAVSSPLPRFRAAAISAA